MNWSFELGFEQPWLLLLLLLVPPLWILSFRSLAGLGGWRRIFALLIRTSVLALLVLALAETQWERKTDQLTVMYLLDQSESIPQSKRDAMLKYVFQSVEKHRRKEDKAGVIIFGANAKIESPPYDGQLPLIGQIESDFDLKTDATNLESALKLAKASFPEDSARRVVIVSDGNENLGDSLSLAKSMAEDGVGIDVVPVNLVAQAEISVDKVLIPSDIRKGQKFEARVVMNNESNPLDTGSPREITGKLRLTQRINQREELIAEQPVTLEPGKNVVSFEHQIEQSAIVTFDAAFVPDDATQDFVQKNNQASAFTHVRGKGKVLLIEDGNHPGEFVQLVERLQANAIEVEIMASNSLYSSAAELMQYDSVILANCTRATDDDKGNAEAFSDEQIKMLVSNCENMGCGIVMIGGERSFGAGGWSNTELEKAMPVDFQIKNDKVSAVGALALMMHASEMADGNFWQLKIAKEAVNVLGPMDFAGVIDWSDMGGNPKWLWRLPNGIDRVSDNRNRMLGLLGRMTPGDMPDFDGPMRLAINGLKNTNASMKHMIIISDGDPAPPTRAILQACKDNKISVTTVAVGTHGPAGSTPLKDIAQFTGGKYYEVRDPRALPKIYQREARRVAKPVIKESKSGMQAIGVSGNEHHEILQGLPAASLPPFFGYVMTTVKVNPLVEQLLIASDPPNNLENTTLLSAWRYGVGRAVVFTTDAGNQWTSQWYNSPYYDKLFSQLVRFSMRPVTEDANFSVGTDVKDNKGRIVVTALDSSDEFINFLNMNARGIDPQLKDMELSFSQTAPGRYVAEFDVASPGNYLFSIFPGEGYERLTAGANVPYSSEYADRETNLALLDALSKFQPKGGLAGQIADGDLTGDTASDLLKMNPFRPDMKQTVSIQSVWPWLLVLCGSVFFADVFVRRVAIRIDPAVAFLRNSIARILGRDTVTATINMDRLKSRKTEINKQIEMRRAATRFEPDVADVSRSSGKKKLDEVLASEQDKEIEPPVPRAITGIDQAKKDEPHTSRLLEVKRRSQRNRPTDPE